MQVGIKVPTSQDSCNKQEAYKYEELSIDPAVVSTE